MSIAERVETKSKISSRDDAISKQLVDARLTAKPLSGFPGQLPSSLQQAYGIQAASIERWPDSVGGWKVARLSEEERVRFIDERLAGPVFSPSIHAAGAGSCTEVAIYRGGFAAVEAEIVLELGVTVHPSAREYSDDDLVELVSAAYGGAEIASSPMAVVNELGAMSVISDFGNNAGLLVGPKIPDWPHLPESFSARVSVDDNTVGEASPDSLATVPLQALRFLLRFAADRGLELGAGCLISTGMLTGVHEVQESSEARVDFGPIGSFDVRFKAMMPRR